MKKSIVMVAMLSLLIVLLTVTPVLASEQMISKQKTIVDELKDEENLDTTAYMEAVELINEELVKLDEMDICATITFSDYLTQESIVALQTENNIEIQSVELRFFDGEERYTAFVSGELLADINVLCEEIAINEELEYSGITAINVVMSNVELPIILQNVDVACVDTSADIVVEDSACIEQAQREAFPDSLSWELGM